MKTIKVGDEIETVKGKVKITALYKNEHGNEVLSYESDKGERETKSLHSFKFQVVHPIEVVNLS
jgi:hypothetical protein